MNHSAPTIKQNDTAMGFLLRLGVVRWYGGCGGLKRRFPPSGGLGLVGRQFATVLPAWSCTLGGGCLFNERNKWKLMNF